ncbi:MAG TPA: glycosyltransferase [Chloroflexota bacterium]|nr:glycosyltransferase [Chloroflexota bacterium]
MRVLLLSKALVVGAYQRKAEELAKLGVELLVVTPPSWILEGKPQGLERKYSAGYRLATEPIALNGHFHVHFYPLLHRRFREFRPELVHVDEEAYNLATFHTIRLARRFVARSVFFTWQNLDRRYPWPFSAMERFVLAQADFCIAGNEEAAAIQRRRGFRKPIEVIPQFGVDPDLFQPEPRTSREGFTVGFSGRLVEEKGLWLLCDAFETLPASCRLLLVGSGPLEASLRARAAERGWSERLTITSASSTAMPELYRQMDCLVLPSLTTPAWKEQFGRAAVEAMACEVPVIGSDSGEIPNVVGDAGIVVPEGNSAVIAEAIERLKSSSDLRAEMGRKGRARVLGEFTQEQIARRTYEVYQRIIDGAK